MCGIAGVIELKDKLNTLHDLHPSNLITHFNRHMQRRGPDSTGYYFDEHVIFTMTRLAIVGGDDAKQPIWNEDKTICVVCNGEIYNYKELRLRLEALGHTFSTKSDVEVIVHLYESFRENGVVELDGDFAFALWDSANNKVFIARDRCGVKPLYYAEAKSEFAFASEFKALLALLDSRKFCDDAMAAYHTLRFCPYDQTIVDNVKKVRPGQFIVVQNGEIYKKVYWNGADIETRRLAQFNKTEQRNRVRDALQEAVKSQTTSDVKTGILLSGGLDSTALLALYRKSLGIVPDSYTVEFEQPKSLAHVTEYRETEHASKVANQFGSRHITECYSPVQVLEQLPEMIAALDEPIADPTAIPLWFAVQLASGNGVKVLYSGEGLDELFNGYDVYRQTQWIKVLNYVPKPMRRLMMELLDSLGLPGAGILDRSVSPVKTWYQSVGGVFTHDELSRLLVSCRSMPNLEDCMDYTGGDTSILREMTNIDLATWLPENTLVKSDKISMYHSVEMRVPFVSRNVVELALKMGDRDKLRGTTGKWIVRKALKDIVPGWVIHRKKAGFPVPLTAWVFGEWRDYAMTTILDPNAFTRPLYNTSYIENLFRVPISQRRRAARLIWTILCLELWIRYVYSFRDNSFGRDAVDNERNHVAF